MRNDPRRSVWRQWDFQFHTPASYDYKDKSVPDEQIVDGLVQAGISAVVITDHHVRDVARIVNLQKLGSKSLTVFPGIELRSELGGSESVHFIGIFPEDADVGRIWTILQAKLEIMPQDVALKSDHRIYVPFVRGAEVIHELGGVVSVHAGKRSNSIEAVRNNADYKMAFKQDLAHDHVDIFEIGDIADLAPYRSLVFRSVGARLPLVMGSDNHDIKSYTRKVPCWVKADCSFSGLCHVLHEPDDRVYLGDLPASVKRVQGSKTKYIHAAAVRKVAESTLPEHWFGCEVPLNSGFVAIIGNKGGGKSALADILALLADSQKGDHFSFLCGEKFRQPRANKATHFEAEITWVSGVTARRLLSDDVDASAVEAVKYVPQSYLEKVCNELGGASRTGSPGNSGPLSSRQEAEAAIVGAEDAAGTLRFHEKEQKALETLPQEIAAAREECFNHSVAIHKEILKLADAHRAARSGPCRSSSSGTRWRRAASTSGSTPPSSAPGSTSASWNTSTRGVGAPSAGRSPSCVTPTR